MSIPPTVSPSTAVNDSNHGPIVTVVAALCITGSLLFLVARGIVRWPWRRLVGRDDVVAGASLLFALIQVAVSCVAANHGLGRRARDLTPGGKRTVSELTYSSNLFFVLSLCLGKLSVTLLLHRLASSAQQLRYTSIGCWACGAYGIVSFLLIASYRPDTINGHHLVARWITVGIMSDVVDVCIIAFPFYLVRDLQMQTHTKFTVVSGFGMRLPVIAFNIARLVFLSRALDGRDVYFAYASVEIWTHFEMNYNLIAATIPCLRIFLRAFHTGRLGGSMEEMDPMDSRFATKGSGTRIQTTRRASSRLDETIRQGSVAEQGDLCLERAEDNDNTKQRGGTAHEEEERSVPLRQEKQETLRSEESE